MLRLSGCLLAPVGLTFLLSACGQQKPAEISKEPLAVVVQIAKVGNLVPTFNATGVIRAKDSATVSFRVAGTIIKRNASLGQKVSADTVLAELDPSDEEQDILAAQASLDAAQADVRLAQSDFDRQKALLDKGVVTKASFERASETLKVKLAAVDGARSKLDLAKQNLTFTKLVAGTNGTITEVQAEKGQFVQAGQAAFTVASDHGLQAVFDVSEALLGNASDHASSDIEVRLVSNPQVKAKAKFAELSPSVDRATGTVQVKIDIIDPPSQMTLGLSVVGTAPGRAKRGYVFPASSLGSLDGKPVLWIVDGKTHRVTSRGIVLAALANDRIVIESGVQDGDVVVTDGIKFLSPDQLVNPGKGARQ